jgi:uncharacterized damage-inducible protein DinB
MASSREFFIETLADELPRFERALKAVPEDELDYRPHEKTRTARELISVFTDEACMFDRILETGVFDMAGFTPGSCRSMGDALTTVKRGFEAALAAARGISEQDWDAPARLLLGEKVEWETTRGKMAWGVLLDLIHHRGQLSVYIRNMGGRVPAIYGPSGDENG